MNADLSTAARFADGTLHGNDRAFNGVSIDTRTLQSDELFVALSGPNFDGRDYVELAREKGAAGAIVVSPVESDIAQITVEDTKLALDPQRQLPLGRSCICRPGRDGSRQLRIRGPVEKVEVGSRQYI